MLYAPCGIAAGVTERAVAVDAEPRSPCFLSEMEEEIFELWRRRPWWWKQEKDPATMLCNAEADCPGPSREAPGSRHLGIATTSPLPPNTNTDRPGNSARHPRNVRLDSGARLMHCSWKPRAKKVVNGFGICVWRCWSCQHELTAANRRHRTSLGLCKSNQPLPLWLLFCRPSFIANLAHAFLSLFSPFFPRPRPQHAFHRPLTPPGHRCCIGHYHSSTSSRAATLDTCQNLADDQCYRWWSFWFPVSGWERVYRDHFSFWRTIHCELFLSYKSKRPFEYWVQVQLDTGSSDLWLDTANYTLSGLTDTGIPGSVKYVYVSPFSLNSMSLDINLIPISDGSGAWGNINLGSISWGDFTIRNQAFSESSNSYSGGSVFIHYNSQRPWRQCLLPTVPGSPRCWPVSSPSNIARTSSLIVFPDHPCPESRQLWITLSMTARVSLIMWAFYLWRSLLGYQQTTLPGFLGFQLLS